MSSKSRDIFNHTEEVFSNNLKQGSERIMDLREVDNHITKSFELLQKQEYIPIGVQLTREERKKLFDFFFEFNKFGKSSFRYKQSLAKGNICEVLEQEDDEIKRIVAKCGVDPKNIFSFKKGKYVIDNDIINSMYNRRELKIGDYTIISENHHPVDRDSDEITIYMKENRESKYQRAKNGEVSFRIFEKKDGKLEEVYYHHDGIHFGEYISFKNKQIGGVFGMTLFVFDSVNNMTIKDVGRVECLDELMPFYYEIEQLLSANLKEQKPNEYKKENA